MKTIKLLNSNNNTAASKKEIPLFLCWRNDSAGSLYVEIKKIRKKYAFSPINEIILETCYKMLNETERDDNSILIDYPDDFIRKMRLTGLISIRGDGHFIGLNTKENNVIDYTLQQYIYCKEFRTEKEFFSYIGQIDNDLISKLSIYNVSAKVKKTELKKWGDYYDWILIKEELLNLFNNKASKDEILMVIEQPLRLEFLISLAILKKLKNVTVKPNFISDDEGLPTSFAAGGNPDIECFENDDTVLVEVALLTGVQQHIRESFSVHRHLETFLKEGIKS